MNKASWLLLAVLAGCQQRPPAPGSAGPVEAVQAFSAAVQRGDAQGAWAMLSKKTQQEADALAADAQKKSGGSAPQSGRQMLFTSALPGQKPTAREVSRNGVAAEVEVSDGSGPPRRYRAVKEGAVWKLDLDLAAR